MPTLFTLLRPLLLCFLLFTMTVSPTRAQNQYATLVASSNGIVTDGSKAADGLLTTNATIKPTLALGYTSLRVRFPTTAAVGKPAGMYIKPNILVSVALLGGATINTYLNSSDTPAESHVLSSNLLNLKVQASGITQIKFLPTEPFNEIELVFFSVLALGQDIDVYEAYSTAAPLPVTLTAFQGKATPAGVALAWQTASERNSAYFEVERADNPAAGFQALGRLASGGTSTQARTYQFVDARPLALGYYRLRQVDLDGTTTFSPVVAVRAELPPAGLAAYPSPAVETLTVTGATGTELELLDQTGRLVRRVPATASPWQQVQVGGLPGGTYFVRDPATGKSRRFVKSSE